MPERYLILVKGLCALFTLLIVLQAGKALVGSNPLDGVVMPNPPLAPEKVVDEVKDPPTPSPAPPGPRMPGPRAAPKEVSPTLQACLDQLDKSGVLGRVPKPVPFVLFGFAGNAAFLRVPNGQSGLVAEGEEFGGVKVLRIGNNRVLLEHEGKQQELTLFSGLGSESLMNSKP